MRKYILDLTVAANEHLREGYALLKLTQGRPLPSMLPGQFAELKVEGSETRCGSSFMKWATGRANWERWLRETR